MKPNIDSIMLLLVSALLAALAAGCAANFSEARPARVLRGGEIRVAQASSVNLPVRVIGDLIEPGEQVVSNISSSTTPTDEESEALVGAAVATALSGIGYGTHIDVGIGLGYRLDLSGRIGNGIYGLSLRRGFDLGRWDASLGLRASYNSGSSWVPYFDEINDYVKVTEMKRFDGQLFAQIGRELGEWGKLWFGAKGMVSPYSSSIDARAIGLDAVEWSDTIGFAGGFFGFALGYRWVHVIAELSVLWAMGDVELYDKRYDLSGAVIVPTWGLQATF
jgi:hypothetical protein